MYKKVNLDQKSILKHVITKQKKRQIEELKVENNRKGKERFKTNTLKKSSSNFIFDRSPQSNIFTI